MAQGVAADTCSSGLPCCSMCPRRPRRSRTGGALPPQRARPGPRRVPVRQRRSRRRARHRCRVGRRGQPARPRHGRGRTSRLARPAPRSARRGVGPEPPAGPRGPRTRAAGMPSAFPFTRSAAAATSSARARIVTARGRPSWSVAPRRSSSTRRPALPSAKSVRPSRHGRPAVSLSTTASGVQKRLEALEQRRAQMRGLGVGVLGSRSTRRGGRCWTRRPRRRPSPGRRSTRPRG